MQNLLAFGLLTTSISAQTVLQQYVDCDIQTDADPSLWGETKFDDIKTKAECKTKLDDTLSTIPTQLTACAFYKQEGEVYTCAYYVANTDKAPSDIRVAKTKEDGAMMFASFHIGKEAPEDELEGVPLAKDDTAGDSAVDSTGDTDGDSAGDSAGDTAGDTAGDSAGDSASTIGGAIMAVFAAVVMTQ